MWFGQGTSVLCTPPISTHKDRRARLGGPFALSDGLRLYLCSDVMQSSGAPFVIFSGLVVIGLPVLNHVRQTSSAVGQQAL